MISLTIAEALAATARRLETAGIDDAHLEAEVLLAHTLGIDRAHLLARLSDPLEDAAGGAFEALVARRLHHEPLAYVTGVREFFGLEFSCGPEALIPRQETELLVEVALAEISRRRPGVGVVDVGTGGGAIAGGHPGNPPGAPGEGGDAGAGGRGGGASAGAIAVNAPGTPVTAVDASTGALALARRNAERHGVAQQIALCRGDLLEGLGAFEVIVANLPYVSARDWDGLAPELRLWEPRDALVGGERGTEIVERLLDRAHGHLAMGGMLAAEIGDTQGAALQAYAHARFPEAEIHVRTDLAGHDRALVVRT